MSASALRWAIAFLAAPSPAGASSTPYALDLAPDVTITTTTATLFAALMLARETLPFSPRCLPDGPERCDPASLGTIDRYALRHRSKTWMRISDVGQIAALTLPPLLVGLDVAMTHTPTPWVDIATDAWVMLEGSLFAGLTTHLLKIATSRPRPRQYDPQRYATTQQSQASFPSGHSTAAGAGASAYAITFWLRHPRSPWRYVVLGTATALAGGTAWARVEAGAHFPSDVAAGLAIGTFFGVLVPWLHRKEVRLSVNPIPPHPGSTVAFHLTLSGSL